jgi:hypothetical protein
MIENTDFRFRDDLHKPEAGDTIPIEILIGPYKGVIYRYVRIGVTEKDNGEAVLRFQYELLEMGDHTETSLRNDQRFTNHIGIILNHLILEVAEAENANGENDPQESTEERSIYS